MYCFYFKIIESIKHHGVYIARSHAACHSHICPANLDHTDTTDTANATMAPAVLSRVPGGLLPTSGIVKVYSHHPFESREKQLVASSYYHLRGRQMLIMCCVDNDVKYTANLLRNMIFKKICKC